MATVAIDSRRGWLKHGNQPGDFLTAPRCGGRTRRGTSCQCPAIRGRRRCRLHGGRSTGPRTLSGAKRQRAAVLKHGRYSWVEREVLDILRELRMQLQQLAGTTRDRLFRRVFASAAVREPTIKEIESIRDLVISWRFRK